jgi:hypothetical protein
MRYFVGMFLLAWLRGCFVSLIATVWKLSAAPPAKPTPGGLRVLELVAPGPQIGQSQGTSRMAMQ